jgi:MFS family permease
MSKSPNRWIGLVFISMAISLVIIDGTIVNTIFPSVIADLSLTSTQVQWVQESYVLVFASLLLVWGSLADRFWSPTDFADWYRNLCWRFDLGRFQHRCHFDDFGSRGAGNWWRNGVANHTLFG